MSAPKKADVDGAASILRRLLVKVDSGELEADGRRGKAVLARIEGVLLGLDAATGTHTPVRVPARAGV